MNLFREIYQETPILSQSTTSTVEAQFHGVAHVKIQSRQKQLMLHGTMHTTASPSIKRENMHPYKLKLILEFTEGDRD